MDNYYTQEGDRPDLATMEVNQPEEYIANQIIPVVPVMDKSGTVYYKTVDSDVAAQTGRSAGSAPTATQISNSSTTFTTAEAIKRGSVTPDEAKTMGGIEKADEVGAKFAKRSVMKAIEAATAAVVTGVSASATFDPAKLRTQIQTAKQSIRRYSGITALVSSSMTMQAIIQNVLADKALGPVFARIVGAANPSQALENLDTEAWAGSIAAYFGVGKVLMGDDDVWNEGDNQGKFSLVKLDNSGDALRHKYDPVFAKNFQFLPDGESPWQIESIPDRLNKNNHYDASNWYNIVVLNSGANYVFEGVQDA